MPPDECCPECGEALAFCECWESEDPCLEELDDVLEMDDDDDDGGIFGGGSSGGGGGGSSF